MRYYMKKNKFALAFAQTFALVFVLVSCSSEGGGSEGKTSEKTKTQYVKVTPKLSENSTHVFSAGDVMYVCNPDVGEKGAVSVLAYDEASGQFSGNLQYAETTDNVRAFVKYAGSAKVTVDTAARAVVIDYSAQNGTPRDAQSRDLAFNVSAAAADFLNASQPLRLYGASAFLRVTAASGTDVKAFRLTSAGTDVVTKTSPVVHPVVFASTERISMQNGTYFPDEVKKIAASPLAGGDTYIAFFAYSVADPVLESDVALPSGINVTQNTRLYAGSAGEDAVYETFESGKTYTAAVDATVKAGTFLCDAQFNVKAIVYDTDNIDCGGYRTARAMSVTDAAGTASWCTAAVLPSSASKYLTSDAASDLRGYELSEYLYGNAAYTAVNRAAASNDVLRGCSAWYLPSAGEWMKFWNNLGGLKNVNKMLKQIGVAQISGVKYWTSSLRSLTEPYAVIESSGAIAPVVQPMQSACSIRASILF